MNANTTLGNALENIDRKKSINEVSKKYDTLQTEIGFQLKEIKDKLKKHSQKQKGSNNWGYVGDIAHVKELLGQINDFLDDRY